MTADAITRLTGDPIPTLNTLWGALIVEELARCGVAAFVLSPGSRSTPLAVAAAAMDPARVPNVVHFDERGAAYCALGWAKATGRPVALICTSGTAAANWLPAVVEAAQTCTPLILLTADRPPELLDTGANQTIDQTKMFGDYVRWQATMPCPDEAVPARMVLDTVDCAVFRATRAPAGPVHLNCMFRDPLAPVPDGRYYEPYVSELGAWRCTQTPFTTYAASAAALDDDAGWRILDQTGAAQRGLIVVGRLANRVEEGAVLQLARKLNWPVFPDIASGLRTGQPDSPLIPYYDQLLLSDRMREICAPDVVLQIGSPLVSKRLLEWLNAHPSAAYLMVAAHPLRHDPIHRVTTRVQMDPAAFCDWLCHASYPAKDAAMLETLRAGSQCVHETIEARCTGAGALTEPLVARLISEHAPQSSALFLGNSMPVRDMDMYASPRGAQLIVGTNRGASGIDGTVATAAGYARARKTPVTVLLGDLALLHDLNSLALARDLDAPMIVVAINNNGGGIFSFLPIASATPHFEKAFATPHSLAFDQAAALFGLRYTRPETPAQFVDAYREALKSAVSTIIEIITDRAANLAEHRAIQGAIVRALETQ